MKDRNGVELAVGQQIVWKRYSDVLEGTIRKIGDPNGGWAGHARVDDGDKDNPDLSTNGFRIAEWVEFSELEVLGGVR